MVLGIEWSTSEFSPSFQSSHLEEWSDLSRWQNWEIQIRLGSVPLSSSWKWASHRQQNFLSALPILWLQALGPSLPVSEEVSMLIPGLGNQIYFQTEISSNGNFTKMMMMFLASILESFVSYANLFRIQAGKKYNLIGPLETWTRI